ncbi:MAG: M20/M25/M40 family metallo-hydrolase [Solirubrobacterales bacterium]|nr:M20/M25/M40 family metallo-hydrolase [Solirubrobacterales bacterium]
MELLSAACFDCELLAAEPERPNLVASLAGRADGPTLTLLGHVDTVRADRDEWTRDPWGGEIADDMVWGRGALDMKGQVASEVAAAVALAGSGWRPEAGTLMVVITADEETGGALGARWLCEQHPEKVRTDMVLNEGGGQAIEFDGRTLFTLSAGEKGICRFLLRTRGRAGHASQPGIGDNALLKLAPHLDRLHRQPPLEPIEQGLGFLAAVLDEEVSGAAGMERAVARLRESEPELTGHLAEPMLGVTLAPTRVSASQKANVIPSVAEALIDCRVPPGYGEAEVRERVGALLDGEDYELEFTETVVGSTSKLDSPLAEAISSWVSAAEPGAALAPSVMAGFSDSNWFRAAFPDASVYGFCPQREMLETESAPLIHSADERVPVADVELAARFFYEIPSKVLAR